ncbi:MAG: thiol reductase thioredoxin, partial [Mastigocladus sp. ERB_26_1]
RGREDLLQALEEIKLSYDKSSHSYNTPTTADLGCRSA